MNNALEKEDKLEAYKKGWEDCIHTIHELKLPYIDRLTMTEEYYFNHLLGELNKLKGLYIYHAKENEEKWFEVKENE